ncbi:MAG: hypothetical protein H6845_02625 [Alphaproteobacteria bacterium]|nr:MAG: hypothetical protein H6845_02625 [Alphaproteobacteria bacterium]
MTKRNYSFLLLILILSGCAPKIERPHYLEKELKEADPVKTKLKTKPKLVVPIAWKEKVSINLHNRSILETIRNLANTNKISIRLADELKDRNTSISMHNTPLLEVIKKLCSICGLRIKIRGNEICIVNDEEYEHIHELTFLSNIRTSNTSTNATSCKNDNSQGINIGYAIELTNSSNIDAWKEIRENLMFILKNENKYTINKQAGILITKCTQKEHRKLHLFLKKLHERISTQVLIEIKILSVKLNHALKTGINWNSLNIYDKLVKQSANMVLSSENIDLNPNPLKVLISDNDDSSTLINLLEQFGEVYTISNPTTTVLNNQYTVLKVAENYTYFTVKQSTLHSQDSFRKDSCERFISSQVHTIPIGTIIALQPSINFKNRTINLFIHPTISTVKSEIEDPSIGIMSQGKSILKSKVPIVTTQEMDSTIRVEDGSLVVIGGLIKKHNKKDKQGIPGVSKVDFLGQTEREQVYEEIVLLIRAHILDCPPSNEINSTQDYELNEII